MRHLHRPTSSPAARRLLGLVLVAGLLLGACTDDSPTASDDSTPRTVGSAESSASVPPPAASSTLPPDGGTTESRPATSTTNPGSPDFCAAFANIPAYAGSLPTSTLEEARTSTIQLASAFGVLVDAAPAEVRPDVVLLHEQSEAIRDATEAAASLEAAQAAAAEINDDPTYVAAAGRAQDWYLANCERPDLGS